MSFENIIFNIFIVIYIIKTILRFSCFIMKSIFFWSKDCLLILIKQYFTLFSEKKRNNQYIDFNNNTKRTDQVISTCTASLLQLHRKEADIFAHRMFHVAITLIMHLVPFGEPILGENICQNFIKISIPPSASCKMSKTSTQNLGNCFQSCMVYNGSSNIKTYKYHYLIFYELV